MWTCFPKVSYNVISSVNRLNFHHLSIYNPPAYIQHSAARGEALSWVTRLFGYMDGRRGGVYLSTQIRSLWTVKGERCPKQKHFDVNDYHTQIEVAKIKTTTPLWERFRHRFISLLNVRQQDTINEFRFHISAIIQWMLKTTIWHNNTVEPTHACPQLYGLPAARHVPHTSLSFTSEGCVTVGTEAAAGARPVSAVVDHWCSDFKKSLCFLMRLMGSTPCLIWPGVTTASLWLLLSFVLFRCRFRIGDAGMLIM